MRSDPKGFSTNKTERVLSGTGLAPVLVPVRATCVRPVRARENLIKFFSCTVVYLC